MQALSPEELGICSYNSPGSVEHREIIGRRRQKDFAATEAKPTEVVLASTEEVMDAFSKQSVVAESSPGPDTKPAGKVRGPHGLGGRNKGVLKGAKGQQDRRGRRVANNGRQTAMYWPGVFASCLSPWTAMTASSFFCDKCQRVFANELKVLQHFRDSMYHANTPENYEASYVLYLYEVQGPQSLSYNGIYPAAGMPQPIEMPPLGKAPQNGPAPPATEATATEAPPVDSSLGVALPHSDLYTPSGSSDGYDDVEESSTAGGTTRRVKKDITGLLSADDLMISRKPAVADTTEAEQAPGSPVAGSAPASSAKPNRRQTNRNAPGTHKPTRQNQQNLPLAKAKNVRDPKAPKAANPRGKTAGQQQPTGKPKEDYHSVFPALGPAGADTSDMPQTSEPNTRWGAVQALTVVAPSTHKLRVDAATWTPPSETTAPAETKAASRGNGAKSGNKRGADTSSARKARKGTHTEAPQIPAPTPTPRPTASSAATPLAPKVSGPKAVSPASIQIQDPVARSATPGSEQVAVPTSQQVAPASLAGASASLVEASASLAGAVASLTPAGTGAATQAVTANAPPAVTSWAALAAREARPTENKAASKEAKPTENKAASKEAKPTENKAASKEAKPTENKAMSAPTEDSHPTTHSKDLNGPVDACKHQPSPPAETPCPQPPSNPAPEPPPAAHVPAVASVGAPATSAAGGSASITPVPRGAWGSRPYSAAVSTAPPPQITTPPTPPQPPSTTPLISPGPPGAVVNAVNKLSPVDGPHRPTAPAPGARTDVDHPKPVQPPSTTKSPTSRSSRPPRERAAGTGGTQDAGKTPTPTPAPTPEGGGQVQQVEGTLVKAPPSEAPQNKVAEAQVAKPASTSWASRLLLKVVPQAVSTAE
eukprot:gene25987-11677_t